MSFVGHVWPGFALVVVCLARAYRAFLLTLLVVALVPTAWGWRGYLVQSGSMEPHISSGDVVVARPLSRRSSLPIGRVMIFTNPDDEGELLIHRVVDDAPDGAYTTAGDANPANDSTPVPRSHFKARAALLVPFLGLPLKWLHGGDVLILAGWMVLTFVALLLAMQPRLARRRDRYRPTSET